MKYKVIVQPLDESEPKVPQSLQDGILCDGFAVIADENVAVFNTNIMKLASVIASKTMLLSAATLAQALSEIKKLANMSDSDEISISIEPMKK